LNGKAKAKVYRVTMPKDRSYFWAVNIAIPIPFSIADELGLI